MIKLTVSSRLILGYIAIFVLVVAIISYTFFIKILYNIVFEIGVMVPDHTWVVVT